MTGGATTGKAALDKAASATSRPAGRLAASSRDGLPFSAAGAALQTLAALCWIVQAAALARAVGMLASGEGVRSVAPLVVLLLLFGLLRAGLDAWGGRLAFVRARQYLSGLRGEAVRALAQRSPVDRGRVASGEAASVVAEQAEAVLPYLSRYLPARWKAMAVPLAILAAVAPFSWLAAVVLVLAAPLIPLFMALIGLKAREASEAQMLEIGGMNAFLLDRLRGLATIRAMDAVDVTATRLRSSAERLRTRTMAVLRIAFLSSAVLELFSALGVALVAVYIGFHFLGALPFGAWGGKLTLADGLFILLLAPAFFEPLRELAAVWHDRAAGVAALDALRRLAQPGELHMPGADAGPGDDAPANKTMEEPPSVVLEDVVFGYGGARRVFDGLSLRIGAGEKVAVLAPSGGGKSTLLALIAGLASADAGRIVVAGETLDDRTAAQARGRMAWVGQKPHLFAGTITRNITLGRPGIGPQAVAAAVAQAALTDVVARRKTGAPVGEAGEGLSGGEALRLALARAAADPHADIILADEPTAHLDPQTAEDVRAGLLRIARGRTLIVATHDPVLAAAMDRVVTLTAGRAP